MVRSSASNKTRDLNDAKPFLKWVGGKKQLLKEIEKYYPFGNDSKITKYVEPFVGGGAVLFDILNKFDLEEVYISDINSELINTYVVIRDMVDELIELLKDLEGQYNTDDSPNFNRRKEMMYSFSRLLYNENKDKKEKPVEIAAWMIFLNKTCFNGVYRVNRSGKFNVPIGSRSWPLICDEDNLRKVSKKLQNVKIACADYRQSIEFIDDKTFVYLDPPYRPLTKTASFVSYTEKLFDDEEQKELAKFVQKIDEIGAKVVISNSDPKNVNNSDNFFEEKYAKQKIKRVAATRMINRNSSGRGKINELLISNF